MSDRREIIEKAFDEAAETPEVEASASPPSPSVGEDILPVEPKDVIPAEEFVKKESSEAKPVVAPKAEEVPKTEEPSKVEEPKTESISDKPPVSWKPAQREQWAKLPADVRAEISRREREIQQTLTQTDQVRKFAQEFAQIVQPYGNLLRQRNATPLQAVQNLMATNAKLIAGSDDEKAQVVANIIGEFGIDIQKLDTLLSQGTPAPRNDQPPPWARPVFDFMGEMQQLRAQAAERQQAEARAQIEKVAEKPFFEDVREEMADLMEVASRRGATLTLEQAYEKAIAMNPDISAILAQRKAAEQARNPVSEAAATLARARRAASTLKGAPSDSTPASRGVPANRREAIEQAWAAQEGRA